MVIIGGIVAIIILLASSSKKKNVKTLDDKIDDALDDLWRLYFKLNGNLTD